MRQISRIEGIAAALPVENVSTDIISPSELYLKPRSAYGPGLFASWRYRPDGSENPGFALNQTKHRGSRILLVGSNFGCGSSREIAVWCLQDYGIECVIGPSFGDIFFDNSLKSGLVAITLDETVLARLTTSVQFSGDPHVTVDLETKKIISPNGEVISFDMDPFRRTVHVEGIEEFDMILRESAAVDAFQARTRAERPWLLPTWMDVQQPAEGASGQ